MDPMPSPADVPTTAGIGSLSSVVDVEPWDLYERIRAAGDILWDAELDGWIVSSHELTMQISIDDGDLWRNMFVPTPDRRPMMDMAREDYIEAIGLGSEKSLIINGDTDHDAIHRWWMRAFSPKVMEDWRVGIVEPIVRAQIDSFAGAGRAELCSQYADHVAPGVMCAILGLPIDDAYVSRIKYLHAIKIDLLAHQTQTDPNPELVTNAVDAAREQLEMLAPYVDKYRSGEGDNFVAMVWRDAPELFQTDDADALWRHVLGSALVAYHAGAGTTSSSAGNALYLIASRPDLAEQLRAGGVPAIERFVEECLRLYGPVDFRPRVATRDTELAGVPIKAGQMVVSLTNAANRDPSRYGCPADVDLTRRAPRDHFAFSKGHRTCPGQALARLQLRCMVEAALDRLPGLRLDPDAEPPRWLGSLSRRWAPVHTVFAAALAP
jgi:cytochrome P450